MQLPQIRDVFVWHPMKPGTDRRCRFAWLPASTQEGPVSMSCFLARILPAFPPQLIHLFIHSDDLVSSAFLFLLFVFGILLVALLDDCAFE